MVDLRKPKDKAENPVLREYTPAHICDEIYPNSTTTVPVRDTVSYEQSLAEFLRGKISKVSHICGKDTVVFELNVFFGEHNIELANVAVENNRVVYLQRKSQISKKYKVITSPLLDFIQMLLVYLESPNSSFDGLCDVLDTSWTANKDDWFYKSFCDFLVDIKTNNTTNIERVLDNEESYCYRDLLGDAYHEWTKFFFLEVGSKLFHGLYNLLAREVEIKVHPLFLFACQNFFALNSDECQSCDDYYKLIHYRVTLTAYGRSLDGVLLKTKPSMPSLFSWVNKYATELYYGPIIFASVSFLIKMLMICIEWMQSLCGADFNREIFLENFLENLLKIDIFSAGMILGIVCFIVAFSLRTIYILREGNRFNTFLYGGLKCFLNSHSELSFSISKEIADKLNALPCKN